jgi:hypothetical protein
MAWREEIKLALVGLVIIIMGTVYLSCQKEDSKSGQGPTDVAATAKKTPLKLDNLIKNGNFEKWSKGPNNFPDHWIGTENAIPPIPQRAEKIKASGKYSLRLHSNGNFSALQQNIPDFKKLRGKTITMGAWIYGNSANTTPGAIDFCDGTTAEFNEFPITSETWKHYTKTFYVRPDASYLFVRVYANYSNTDNKTNVIYVDDVVVVEGTTVP